MRHIEAVYNALPARIHQCNAKYGLVSEWEHIETARNSGGSRYLYSLGQALPSCGAFEQEMLRLEMPPGKVMTIRVLKVHVCVSDVQFSS